jgi:hypothetical protein
MVVASGVACVTLRAIAAILLAIQAAVCQRAGWRIRQEQQQQQAIRAVWC